MAGNFASVSNAPPPYSNNSTTKATSKKNPTFINGAINCPEKIHGKRRMNSVFIRGRFSSITHWGEGDLHGRKARGWNGHSPGGGVGVGRPRRLSWYAGDYDRAGQGEGRALETELRAEAGRRRSCRFIEPFIADSERPTFRTQLHCPILQISSLLPPDTALPSS